MLLEFMLSERSAVFTVCPPVVAASPAAEKFGSDVVSPGEVDFNALTIT